MISIYFIFLLQPFGKRSGTKKNNIILYKKLMTEFARVLKLETGRLVLLTQDSPHLYKVICLNF